MLGMTGGFYFSLFVYSNLCRKIRNIVLNNKCGMHNLTDRKEAFPSVVDAAARRCQLRKGMSPDAPSQWDRDGASAPHT